MGSFNTNEFKQVVTQASPEPQCVATEPVALGGLLQFHCRGVRVHVRACDSCRSKCLWLHRSAQGGVHMRAAFPCYICKGRSCTYFLLQIKENMSEAPSPPAVLWQPVVLHVLGFREVWREISVLVGLDQVMQYALYQCSVAIAFF